MLRVSMSKLASVLAIGVAALTMAVTAEAQVKVESLTAPVRTIPATSPHRVIVYDQNFPHLNDTAAYLINGDTGEVEGMLGAGEQANLAFSPRHDRIYVADTYWSRLHRGTRTDVVITYDTSTLLPVHEVEIPAERFIVVSKKLDGAATPDGRYVLVFNETPASSVSVIDVANQKYIGKIDARGCWGVMPTTPTRFHMICGNGSLLTVSFKVDAGGKLESSAHQDKPFFDVKNDAVFDAPNVDARNGRLVFISKGGLVHTVDVSAATPSYAQPWSLLTDADRAENWVPGGWQAQAYDAASGRLYVLMHRGNEWTYKFPGNEVWVFDSKTRKRIQRLKLREQALSIGISADGQQLYALDDAKATLDIYRLPEGQLLHSVDQLGLSPSALYTSQDH